MHRLRTLLPLSLVLAGIGVRPYIVRGQSSALTEGAPVSLDTSIRPAVCGESMPASHLIRNGRPSSALFIYVHSWGASQAVTLALELEGLDIADDL